MSTVPNVTAFVQKAAKSVIAAAGVVTLVAGALITADPSTVEGIVAAAVGVATVLGVYNKANKPA